MKNISIVTVFVSTLILATSAHAGTGHSHDKDGGHSNHGHTHGEMNAEKASAKATHTMQNMVKRGVIDKSWASVQAAKAEKKSFSKGDEWVVSFKNDKIGDKEKQVLYIFYSLDGHYIAANYTGK